MIDQLAEERYGRPAVTWIGSENFMLGFFAAAANADSRHNGAELVAESLNGLIDSLRNAGIADPLGHESYQAVAKGIDSRKSNVGYATRKLIFNGFREFFRSRGEDPLLEIWPREAD